MMDATTWTASDGTTIQAGVTQPDWHDQPPVPGWYAFRRTHDSHGSGGAVLVDNPADWKRSFLNYRWYGPIPKDPRS